MSGSSQALTGKITTVELPVKTLSSNVGRVDPHGLVSLVNAVVHKVALPLVNAFLAKGIALPSLDGLELTNTLLQPALGHLLLATDFTYTG